jgi:COP9 signalosome complex subunit 7
LLTLAANTTPNTPLTYTNLQSSLSLPSPLALERLVTDAIYADLLSATLNPASLDTWSNTCDDVLKDLEAQMKSVMEAAERRSNEEAVRAEQVRKAEASGKKNEDTATADDAMEVDDGGQKAGGKKRGLGGLGLRKR